MKLSFIIPTLNEAEGIDNILRSLQYLRKAGHEIIIADGGSTDNTIQIAQPLVDKIVQCPKGRAIQQNRGAMLAVGDYLFFLHADTQIPINFESIIKKHLKKNVIWGRFDVRLSGNHVFFRIIEKMMNWRSRLTRIATGDQLIFCRKDIFTQIGGFKEIALMEDIELSGRLKKISPPYFFSEKVITSSKKWEKNGIVSTILLMWWLRLNYFFGKDPRQLVKLYYPKH